MSFINEHLFAVILAGGRGRRLWPASRVERPKQFIDFFGSGKTLLLRTYDRLSKIIDPKNIYVCTTDEYLPLVEEQLPMLDGCQKLVEPIARNTAPSVAWASERIGIVDSQACLLVVPSDQLILDDDIFSDNVSEGYGYVKEHNVALAMAIKPTRPEPGYGYIQLGEYTGFDDVFHIQSFTEKPSRDFAMVFMESGEFFWNTGLFLTNIDHLRRCMTRIFPEEIQKGMRSSRRYSPADELMFIQKYYSACPNVSLDLVLLERSVSEVCVMKCDFGWADIGAWHSVYDALCHGTEENVVIDSRVILEQSKNNIIKLPKNMIGVINGLDGYIIAEYDNVLLICPKEDSSSLVKKYVNETEMKYGEDYV